MPPEEAQTAAFDAAFRSQFAGVLQRSWGGEGEPRRFASAALGGMRLSRLAAPSHVASWPGPSRIGAPATLKVIAQVQGRTEFVQDGERFELEPGGWLLCLRRRPYDVVNRTAVEQVVVEAPLDAVAHRAVARLRSPVTYARPQGLPRIFRSMLVSLSEDIDALTHRDGAAFADTVGDLLSALILSEAGRHLSDAAPADLLCERAELYIHAHVTDPELSVGRLARALNCSERYLYKAFQGRGVTPDRYLWNARLDRCREALIDEAWSRSTISEIAYRHGFSSGAHFSRAFRERFGMTPRDARRAG